MLRTHAGTLAALGASREAALTTLGPVRDADAALNDAVLAARHGARAFFRLPVSRSKG